MLWSLFLIAFWPLVIFLAYKFIKLNISEIQRREEENQ